MGAFRLLGAGCSLACNPTPPPPGGMARPGWVWTKGTSPRHARSPAHPTHPVQPQLLAGAAPRNLPNLRNLAMELRKVCCHPVGLHTEEGKGPGCSGRCS